MTRQDEERRPGGAVEALRRALEGAPHRLPTVADGTVSAELERELRRLAATFGAAGVARVAVEVAGGVMHPPGVVCGIVPGARRTDPSTSSQAAERAVPRAKAVAGALLRAYAFDDAHPSADGKVGLNADEAADVVERWILPGGGQLSGSWRRISDLCSAGLIEPGIYVGTGSPVTRPGRSGREQTVYSITAAGRQLVESWRS